jgi:F0F1-type ATP synthase membrane subunit c/vacuolar-type H+-ATPase subunit K
MMDLNNCSILKETDDHYHVMLPSGRQMQLEKGKLQEKAHAIIKKMRKAQHFEDGGMASNIKDSPEQIAAEAAAMAPAKPLDTKAVAPAADAAKSDGSTMPAYDSTAPYSAKIAAAEIPLQAEKEANLEIARLKGGEEAAKRKAYDEAIKQLTPATPQQPLKTQAQIFNEYSAKDSAFENALKTKIDPDRYIHNMSTPAKIASGIGMIIGAMGTGFGNQNMGAKVLQDAIDRDIEAQKNDQTQAMNLWKMNHEAMRDDMTATLQTQNQMMTMLKTKVDRAAALNGAPLALQNAKVLNAQIDQKIADNRFKMSLMDPANGETDPSVKVQYLVPQSHQAEVFKEIKRAQDVHDVSKDIMTAYDEAAKDLRPLSGGRLKNVLPLTESAYANKLEGLLMTTVQDLEGTVKQAAMENVRHNFMPHTFNSDLEVQERRKALEEYLNGKKSAPVAKGYGIDLERYRSTRAPEKTIEPEQRMTASGKIALFDPQTKKFMGYK